MTARGPELFISDLHLSPHEPGTFRRFRDFLAGPARSAARLTLLGDLFDAWAGDDDLADPFNAAVVRELRALVAAGVPVDFVAGNRDFLVGADFAAASGASLLPDPCLREVAGIATLLTHGDTLCTDDADYQRFRAEVRSPAWRAEFLARPLAERKRLIEQLRQRSETEKQGKAMRLMDVNAHAVAALLREYAAASLIHGHTHRQARHAIDVAGRACVRWALGDWTGERGTALACTTEGCRFLA